MMTADEIVFALEVAAVGWALVAAITIAKRWWEGRNPNDWERIEGEVRARGTGGLSDAWLTTKLQWRSVWRYFTT